MTTDQITDAEGQRRGKLIAEALNLRLIKGTGRYHTTWGTLTALGLFRAIESVVKATETNQ